MSNKIKSDFEISVVIPVYNAQDYVESCIQALLSQSISSDRYEIIMVDNNSTDESYEIIQRYPCINLLAEPKQGSYAARNQGVRSAQAELIAFTDPDCIPSRNWLRNILAAMHRSDIKPLSNSERLRLYKSGLSQVDQTLFNKSSLLLLLVAGLGCYNFGRLCTIHKQRTHVIPRYSSKVF